MKLIFLCLCFVIHAPQKINTLIEDYNTTVQYLINTNQSRAFHSLSVATFFFCLRNDAGKSSNEV